MSASSYCLAEIIQYLADHGIDVTISSSSPDNSPQASSSQSGILHSDTTQIEQIIIHGMAKLETATTGELAFLANPRYASQLTHTGATAVLVTPQAAQNCPSTVIALIVANPYRAYAILSQLFAYQPLTHLPKIHPTAIIGAGTVIGKQVRIGAYCVIGEQVTIGDGSQLGNHITLEDHATLGENCRIADHVFIAHHCQLGDGVTLHSHASIGNAGFGYAPNDDTAEAGWQPIAQLGKVVIGNHVRVGSHTCIDRGALGNTVIEDHVIIDNLVQIAHNVHIGAGTAIAACVGIAGSTKIGKRCTLAGGAGVTGHIEICDDVMITGMTMVTKSITQAGSYSSGTAMMPTPLWRKAAVKFKQLAIRESRD